MLIFSCILKKAREESRLVSYSYYKPLYVETLSINTMELKNRGKKNETPIVGYTSLLKVSYIIHKFLSIAAHTYTMMSFS